MLTDALASLKKVIMCQGRPSFSRRLSLLSGLERRTRHEAKKRVRGKSKSSTRRSQKLSKDIIEIGKGLRAQVRFCRIWLVL